MTEKQFSLAYLIRAFEEQLLVLFKKGLLNGTVHTCSGQEMVSVGLNLVLGANDTVVSNHRGHGHFLATTGDVEGLLAEIMGKQSGVCGGIGGSQHLYSAQFISNGIQGGMTPTAVGFALAKKKLGNGGIVYQFIGDGTLGQGVLYEAMNIAARWELPLIIIVENNGYAQSTPSERTLAGSIQGRAEGFGFKYFLGETERYEELFELFRTAKNWVVDNQQPVLLEVKTYRLNAHSKGDDLRDLTEIAKKLECDPLNRIMRDCSPEFELIKEAVDSGLLNLAKKIENMPHCKYSPELQAPLAPINWIGYNQPQSQNRINDLIYAALRELLEKGNSCLFGEDITHPYNGAFNVTRDLSKLFPERVMSTPIAEASIVGLATGLALSGFKTIVEIMFGDFMTLCLDQLSQHATKFREMYGRDVKVPLIIRTPMGGRRGYGPTHSQSYESIFTSIYGVKIFSLNQKINPMDVYTSINKNEDGPVLVLENKILYTRVSGSDCIEGFRYLVSDDERYRLRVCPINSLPLATLVVHGGMVEYAEKAISRLLREFEIPVELVVPCQISPLDVAPILNSASITRCLFVFEEGNSRGGFGSEVIASIIQAGIDLIIGKRFGYDGIVPSSAQRERELLIDDQFIVATINSELGHVE